MNSTIHRKKTVTQSITMSQNNKEHRIHNREKVTKMQIKIRPHKTSKNKAIQNKP
jgi:hypothetical protein